MLALCSEYGDDARKKILPYSNWPTTDDSHLRAHHAGQNTLKAAGSRLFTCGLCITITLMPAPRIKKMEFGGTGSC
jgi:hypothetical protein